MMRSLGEEEARYHTAHSRMTDPAERAPLLDALPAERRLPTQDALERRVAPFSRPRERAVLQKAKRAMALPSLRCASP